MSSDPYPGHTCEPSTLHRYLYVSADPVNRSDPSGMLELAEYSGVASKITAQDVAEAAALSFAVTCLMYRVASMLDPGIIPQIPPPFQFCARRARWTCTARCHVNNFSDVPGVPDFITGTGSGPTKSMACQEAMDNAVASAPRGTTARHCRCPPGWCSQL